MAAPREIHARVSNIPACMTRSCYSICDLVPVYGPPSVDIPDIHQCTLHRQGFVFRTEFSMKCHQFHSFLAAVLTAPLLASCTSVQVRQVDAQVHQFDYVCIKDNPKVMVVDFVSVMEDVFRDHGISSELFYGDPPAHCEYVLTYTARRSWDFVPYLSYAELKIRKGREFVASARYKHNGGSMSWAPNKWNGTRTKMEPVINEMLGRGPSSQSLAQQTDRTSSRTGHSELAPVRLRRP